MKSLCSQRAAQQVFVPDRLKLRFLKVVLLVKVVYNQNGFAGPAAGKFSRWAAEYGCEHPKEDNWDSNVFLFRWRAAEGASMGSRADINHITIRTDLKSGDIGYIVYLHGFLYKQEYDYGIEFESYVAAGLSEFCDKYDPHRSRVWICEHNDQIVGSLLLMDRGKAAQLRYFLIRPGYRGIGLGSRLMELYIEFLHKCDYESAYLWTTQELHTAAYLYLKHGFGLTEEKASTAFGRRVVEQRYELVI